MRKSFLFKILLTCLALSLSLFAFFGCKKLHECTYDENGICTVCQESKWEKALLFSDGKIVGVSRFGKTLTEIVVPETYGGVTVTELGRHAFDDCVLLEKLSLPNTITSIKPATLASCPNLKYNVQNGLKYLGNSENEYLYLFGVDTLTVPNPEISENCKLIVEGAFYGCEALESIIIPDNVITIGDYAFQECTSLTSAVIGNGITSLGYDVFRNCSALENVTIPNSVTLITMGTFDGCENLNYTDEGGLLYLGNSENPHLYLRKIASANVTSAIVNQNCKIMGYNLFKNCKLLETVSLPNSVTSINASAFEGCSSLQSISIPSGVTKIGGYAFKNCSSLESISIPSSVTEIGGYAFNGCTSLQSVSLAEGLTTIGRSAFEGCSSLQSVSIPSGVTEISDYAFKNCSSLESVSIPSGVTEIGSNTFEGCSSLESISIPSGVTEISDYAFKNCSSLQSISIPSGVTSINASAFNGCTSLQSVILAEGLTTIGYGAFRNCSSLQSVSIPSGVTEIGGCAFNGCTSLQSVILAEGLTTIGYGAFGGCSSLQNISIPNTISSMDANVFDGCNNLTFKTEENLIYLGNSENEYLCLLNVTATDITSAVVNSNCKLIASRVFADCALLESVIIPNSVEFLDGDAFVGNPMLVIYAQAQSKPAGWNIIDKYEPIVYNYTNNEVASNGNIYIEINGIRYSIKGDNATVERQRPGLTVVSIPETITYKQKTYTVSTITEGAFYGFSSLESITVPFVGASKNATGYKGTIGYIFGRKSFSDSYSVRYDDSYSALYDTSVIYYIPQTLKTVIVLGGEIGKKAFYECDSLTSVTLSNSVTSIGDDAFYDCDSLTSVTLSDSVTSIGHDAFYDCDNLVSVNLPKTLQYLGCAFSRCENLTTISIPNSVTYICSGAFSGCSNLEYYEENGLKYLGSNENKYLYLLGVTSKNITNAVINENCRFMGGSVFQNCSYLTSVIIPEGMEDGGGGWAFKDCPLLTIYCEMKSKVQGWSTNWASGNPVVWDCNNNDVAEDGNIYVVVDNVRYAIKDGTAKVVKQRGVLTSATIRSSITHKGKSYAVTTIESYAFAYQTALTSIVIESGVTKIEGGAFDNCTSLTSIVIPNSVTTIDGGAFNVCPKLKIYCEAQEKPSGWDEYWNLSYAPVEWGYTES